VSGPGDDGVELSGHFWTVAPRLAAWLRRPPAPPAVRLRLPFVDAQRGAGHLTAWFDDPPAATAAVVILHGLAGSGESPYARGMAAAARARGLASLRLDLRGAGGEGADFYHAGLTADLRTALAAPALARYDALAVVGFSLGGHLALRWAGEEGEGADPRVVAIATVCAPLDLELGARALDAGRNRIYRKYILDGLKAMAERIERRHPGTIPAPRARRAAAGSIREWDGLVVAPRFGFASAEDYYARASAAPLLARVRVPTWLVAGRHDPMVPRATLEPALERISPAIEATWCERGGHVGMPPGLDLGRPGGRGLANQLAGWIGERLKAR